MAVCGSLLVAATGLLRLREARGLRGATGRLLALVLLLLVFAVLLAATSLVGWLALADTAILLVLTTLGMRGRPTDAVTQHLSTAPTVVTPVVATWPLVTNYRQLVADGYQFGLGTWTGRYGLPG